LGSRGADANRLGVEDAMQSTTVESLVRPVERTLLTTGLSGEDREEVARWVSERTVDEVVQIMDEAGVPAAPVYDVEDALANEHSRARGLFVEVDTPLYGRARLPGYPFKLSEADGDLSRPAPRVGEHNHEVYSRLLGLSEDELKRLSDKGVI